jgi:SAM-dependent methyltransferase
MSHYYANKVQTLTEIFGVADVILDSDCLRVRQKTYPIIDDVIILLEERQYTPFIRNTLQTATKRDEVSPEFSTKIQYSFGAEWKSYDQVLPEHAQEFQQYFDLVDVSRLQAKRVCDLGCGNGRWSYFLQDACQAIILVDFSDAIFTARKNLADADNCLFFMGDLKSLPFTPDAFDFLFCLGVLHHLPTSCLDEVRNLKKFAPELLIFLYYAFDNRPFYFRWLLKIITCLRVQLAKTQSLAFRNVFTKLGTYGLYLPLIYVGYLLKPLHLSSHVPLYDFYHNKSVKRIQQDVYDRFFTSIEQRVSRKEILRLRDTFSEVIVADHLPYWHFLCRREERTATLNECKELHGEGLS